MEKIAKNTLFYDLPNNVKNEVTSKVKEHFLIELGMSKQEMENEFSLILGGELLDLAETINIYELETASIY